MAALFACSELLEVALEIEKNGQAFYEELSNCAKEKGVLEVAKFMAEEEKRHYEKFKTMLDVIGESHTTPESYPGEYQQYVKALADSRVFTEEHEIRDECRRLKNDSDAIQMAIGLEKDSIIFYNEMSRFVRESDRPTVGKIIDEERRHIAKLWELKTKLATA